MNAIRKSNGALPKELIRNARSICCKVDDLFLLAAQHEAHIICPNGTWLKPEHADECVAIEGYTMLRTDRPGNKQGCGTCIYINTNFCTLIKQTTLPTNSVAITLAFLRPCLLFSEFSRIIVLSVYIPPLSDKQLATKAIIDVCEKMQSSQHPGALTTIADSFNRTPVSPITFASNTVNLMKTSIRGNVMLNYVLCIEHERYKIEND